MAQQGGRGGARVPKFGEWGNQRGHDEQQKPVPYTMYFDNARKDKQQQSAASGGGAIKIINPNDPEENPEMFSPIPKSTPPPLSSDRDYSKEPQSQPQRPGPAVKPPPTYHHHHQPQQERTNRRSSAGAGGSGSEHNSFDRSPLHQAIRTTPGREPNNTNSNSSTSTPPRTRTRRPGTGSREDLSHHAVIPKFGAWNEHDPSSAEDLTQIFERSRNDKNYASSDRTPPRNNIITTPTRQPAKTNEPKICCCFSW